ncbi:MAG TPA: hypothetical protein PLH79_13275 [bacterium]|nr:hypothetical protein [bacterium]HPP02343.1 hypothetical protein [bacterium]HXK93229.1 hypothetical protein [bacterium]
MPRYGRYDPQNPNNTSAMFIYQEVPLTSSKMNRWNGNLAAAFELLHQTGARLLAQAGPAVITARDDSPLRVTASSPPQMTVRVMPGWAVLGTGFAGIAEAMTVPLGGSFTPPGNAPRIDLVVLTDQGELEVITGLESDPPFAPEAPGDTLALARIVHRAGADRILDADDGLHSYIVDIRPRLLLGEAHRHASDLRPSEPPDGVRQAFSTRHVFRPGTLDVFVNGVLQARDVDYVEDPGRRGYTFLKPPPGHYRIQHRYVIEYEVE